MNYIDLSFTFDIGDKGEIFATVNNVFDEDPPIIVGQGGYGNTFPATYDYAGMTRVPGSQLQDVLIKRRHEGGVRRSPTRRDVVSTSRLFSFRAAS